MKKLKLGKALTKEEQVLVIGGGDGEGTEVCRKPPGTVLLSSTFTLKDDSCITSEPKSMNYENCDLYRVAYLAWYAVCGAP